MLGHIKRENLVLEGEAAPAAMSRGASTDDFVSFVDLFDRDVTGALVWEHVPIDAVTLAL